MKTKKRTLHFYHYGYFLILLVFTAHFLPAQSITVLSPNGTEEIAAGGLYLIEWTSTDIFSDVRIEYSVDNTQDGLVRIYSANNPTVEDISDQNFYIYPCQVEFQSDNNEDCYINLGDFVLLAGEWLLCGNPLDPSCNTVCPDGYADCDGFAYNGCEVDLTSNVGHCGACGVVCSFPNAEALCIDSNCVMGDCLPGYYDLNGDPIDGCESSCQPTGIDVPDAGFVDADCDGIDGDLDEAVFVDFISGDDLNAGTDPLAPVKTITAGINAAITHGRSYVLISQGTYNETLSLVSGISLYGQYNAASGWDRSSSYTTTVSSNNLTITGATVSTLSITHLDITSDNQVAAGQSAYTILLDSASDV